MTVLDKPAAEAPQRRRRRPRRRILFAGTAVLAVGAAGAAMALRGGSSGGTPAAPATSTAAVERTDVAERTQVDGTLGYARTFTVVAAGQGRLTWLPVVGAVIRRGARVYGLDGHDVPLFYGATPFWRKLESGMTDGRDVKELETNLAALGYGADAGMTVDRHFSAATAAAVREWQDDLGVTQDGAVELGDVVVLPGALRVKTVGAVTGGTAQGNLLTGTGTTRQITVKLPVGQQTLARAGARVQVELPGGTRTTGHISSVGSVATSTGTGTDSAQQQPGQNTQNATVPVYVTLDHASAAGRLDGAPVTVGFTSALHKGVLTVPVNALLAAPDGSYAVSVAAGTGGTRRVPVRLGAFADGRVEVTGALTAGTRVEVPAP